MFNTYDVGQMWHWWGPLQRTLYFPVTAQPDDWCASHLVRWKHSWIVTPRSAWSAIPPYAAACEITCKFISYPYPLTTFVYNGCLSKLCHDGCDGKKSGTKHALFSVSTTVFWQAGCWMPILQRFLHWRFGCAISGLSPKLLPCSPAWPLS